MAEDEVFYDSDDDMTEGLYYKDANVSPQHAADMVARAELCVAVAKMREQYEKNCWGFSYVEPEVFLRRQVLHVPVPDYLVGSRSNWVPLSMHDVAVALSQNGFVSENIDATVLPTTIGRIRRRHVYVVTFQPKLSPELLLLSRRWDEAVAPNHPGDNV